MTKIELVERLTAIRSNNPRSLSGVQLAALIEDIEADGVLDVQQPPVMLSNELTHLPTEDVQRMHRALIEAGLTRADLRGCTIADLIALHGALPS